MSKLAVVAIGGNSLIKDDAHKSVPDQFSAVRETAAHIAEMIAQGWNVVVTHGNGPQVGFILLRSEYTSKVLHTVPLDSCGADTQGAIGYMIQQSLHNEFLRRDIRRQCVTVVTQVLVSRNDPALHNPSKPIGSFYREEEARLKMAQEGWTMVEDAGRGWRRVVPSPQPREIIECDAIETLIKRNFIVVAVGGGGIPVVRDAAGNLTGIEGVIDKDLASSLLASDLDNLTLSEAKRYYQEGHFAKGSMGPKIQAVINYLENGGHSALITMPESIGKALSGQTGTWIRQDS